MSSRKKKNISSKVAQFVTNRLLTAGLMVMQYIGQDIQTLRPTIKQEEEDASLTDKQQIPDKYHAFYTLSV